MIATGVNASPGAAVGVAAFDADLAEKWGKAKRDVIMVRPETKPDDVHGMLAAKGILTSRGGATSHAAVVARQFGVPCVCGAEALDIDVRGRVLKVGDTVVKEGETISIDGSTGEVFLGEISRMEPDFHRENYLIKLLELGGRIPSPGHLCQRRLPERRPPRPRLRRSGCGSVPYRAHVLPRRASADCSGDDPLRAEQRRRAGRA